MLILYVFYMQDLLYIPVFTPILFANNYLRDELKIYFIWQNILPERPRSVKKFQAYVI